VRFLAAALGRRSAAREDTVLATHCGLASVGRILRRAAGARRFVVFLHGVECWNPIPPRTRWGLRGATLLIANSAHTLARFRAAHPDLAHLPGEVCPLPARALPEAVDAGQGPKSARGPRAIVVGRLWGRGMRKGQDILIRCWPEVLAAFPGAELVVVGGGEGRASLEALARETGVEGAVRFTGLVTDGELSAWYRASDLFALPSEGEGFGLVFAEAMARGLPCIASSRDAGSEVVQDGVTGLVVDPRDEKTVAAALLRLLGDAALRARMGTAGRERAERLYSVDGFRARILELLEVSRVGR
jgi:phosphatidylinositol alpha-1,6-mannosyltransferase